MGPGRRTAHETFLFPFFFIAAPLAPGDKMSLAHKPNEQSNLTQINILKKKEEKKKSTFNTAYFNIFEPRFHNL